MFFRPRGASRPRPWSQELSDKMSNLLICQDVVDSLQCTAARSTQKSITNRNKRSFGLSDRFTHEKATKLLLPITVLIRDACADTDCIYRLATNQCLLPLSAAVAGSGIVAWRHSFWRHSGVARGSPPYDVRDYVTIDIIHCYWRLSLLTHIGVGHSKSVLYW